MTFSQSYDPFGNVIQTAGEGDSGFGYTGEQLDDSGLEFLRARYYDPEVGRFISADPFPGILSLPATQNAYQYGINNPLSHTDPSGEVIPFLVAGGIGALVGGGMSMLSQCLGYSSFSVCMKCMDWSAVGAAAAAGAIAGAVGFGLGLLMIPAGAGLGLSVFGGFLIGALTGQLYRAAELGFSGNWDQIPNEIGHWQDILTDGAIGSLSSAIGWGLGKAYRFFFGCSFSEDTPVTTDNGEKEISEIEVGDSVLAWNQEEGVIDYYPVTATIAEEHQITVNLIIDGEWIKTTPEHPFFTEEYGWIQAGVLKPGLHILKSDMESGLVWLVWEAHISEAMYNLTVDTAHTYFIGDGQWLVHNSCGSGAQWDLHHLIPKSLKNHPLLIWAERGGWKINADYNLMSLPNNNSLAQRVNLPYHSGGHRIYTNTVKNQLDDFFIVANNQQWTSPFTSRFLKGYTSLLRKFLESQGTGYILR